MQCARGAHLVHVFHLFNSEVHVFPGCKRCYHRTYCTVSPYGFTRVSFMASCGHHWHLHLIEWS